MDLLKRAIALYGLEGYDLSPAEGHEGGRNSIYICRKGGENKYALRISATGDRTEEEARKVHAVREFPAGVGRKRQETL